VAVVGVVASEGYSEVSDVVEGPVVITALAAQVAISPRAVDELLLGQVDCLVFELGEGLEHADCTESPARTTEALVFDGSHHALSHPVNVNSVRSTTLSVSCRCRLYFIFCLGR